MSVLHLTLKKKWFDMIASGEKKEEYREKKDYWVFRLCNFKNCIETNDYNNFKHFDIIEFRNGYSKNAPKLTVQCLGIKIGQAKPEWSDNWQGDVFIIKLGDILK